MGRGLPHKTGLLCQQRVSERVLYVPQVAFRAAGGAVERRCFLVDWAASCGIIGMRCAHFIQTA